MQHSIAPSRTQKQHLGFEAVHICPVRIFVENALWLSVASLLACFDLDKVLNEDGVEIELLKLRLH